MGSGLIYKILPGLIGDGDAWLFFPKKEATDVIKKFGVSYTFQAFALGETTLIFTRSDELHAEPKTLTFRFNVVAASAAPDNSNSDNNNKKNTTPEQK